MYLVGQGEILTTHGGQEMRRWVKLNLNYYLPSKGQTIHTENNVYQDISQKIKKFYSSYVLPSLSYLANETESLPRWDDSGQYV